MVTDKGVGVHVQTGIPIYSDKHMCTVYFVGLLQISFVPCNKKAEKCYYFQEIGNCYKGFWVL